jgi:hypothetical protein
MARPRGQATATRLLRSPLGGGFRWAEPFQDALLPLLVHPPVEPGFGRGRTGASPPSCSSDAPGSPWPCPSRTCRGAEKPFSFLTASAICASIPTLACSSPFCGHFTVTVACCVGNTPPKRRFRHTLCTRQGLVEVFLPPAGFRCFSRFLAAWGADHPSSAGRRSFRNLNGALKPRFSGAPTICARPVLLWWLGASLLIFFLCLGSSDHLLLTTGAASVAQSLAFFAGAPYFWVFLDPHLLPFMASTDLFRLSCVCAARAGPRGWPQVRLFGFLLVRRLTSDPHTHLASLFQRPLFAPLSAWDPHAIFS